MSDWFSDQRGELKRIVDEISETVPRRIADGLTERFFASHATDGKMVMSPEQFHYVIEEAAKLSLEITKEMQKLI